MEDEQATVIVHPASLAWEERERERERRREREEREAAYSRRDAWRDFTRTTTFQALLLAFWIIVIAGGLLEFVVRVLAPEGS